jgi:uncharacterized protein YyaL (SSP411 family)
MVAAIDYRLRTPREIVLLGPAGSDEIRVPLRALWREFRPHDLIVAADPQGGDLRQLSADVPLLDGKRLLDDAPTYYVCESYACQAPTGDVDELMRQATD